MSRILIYISLILSFFPSCSAQEMKDYESDSYKASYPINWTKQQKGTATFFLSPKK